MDLRHECAAVWKRWKSLDPPINWQALLSNDDRSDWATIHRYHALQMWNQRSGIRQKLVLLIEAALWPAKALVLAAHCTRIVGRHVECATGIPRKRQFLAQLRLACFDYVSPAAYYMFRLYLPENEPRAHRFLHRYESKKPAQLFTVISNNPSEASRMLCDKLVFHDRCVEHGIATPRIHMVFEDGHQQSAHGSTRLPAANLFVKPLNGKGGNGAEAWNLTPQADYEGVKGERLEAPALYEKLRRESCGRPLLVQQRLENHPDLAVTCGPTFATARIMTVVNESGRPEPVIAVFRMATGNAVVDNFHRGGLAAGVDLKTGELGSAIGLSPFSERTDIHPKTGLRFAGMRIPGWHQALRLAVRAHDAFPGRTVVGWDIGFTAVGPVVVEGNSSPGILMLQCATGEPLGETRMAQLLAYHLRHRPVQAEK